MQVGHIRKNIEQLSDDVEIFIAWYDKDEAQEHIQNNLMEDFNASSDIVLTEDEWKSIVNKMGNDVGIWNELNESFKYYVEQAIENREKGKEDVNSK
jgi:5S rRNA maturation endonuclease (ribonuclease M5)